MRPQAGGPGAWLVLDRAPNRNSVASPHHIAPGGMNAQ
jgi:hypothetical protein